MIRRILDYFHLASYPEWTPRRSGCELGLNVHQSSDAFEWMYHAGFGVAIVDFRTETPAAEFDRLLQEAKKWKLKVFVVGLPVEGSAADHARLLFSRYGTMIDYLSVYNEPDLASQGYRGSIEDLGVAIREIYLVRQTYAPHVKICAPSFSSRGSSCRPGWRDKREVLERLTDLGCMNMVDLLSWHVYQRTPDAALRYVQKITEIQRITSWTKPLFISEIGWESKHILGRRAGEYRQALYLSNAVRRASWLTAGVGVYVAQDDPAAEDYHGIHRVGGVPKPAALRFQE